MTKEPTPPIRTCVGCGKKQAKALLHRLVLDEKNQPLLDRTQGAPGRGAYLCGPGCLAAAVKRKALQRAFKKNVALDVTTLEAAFLQ
ncbi:MAG: YlxR family protein [Myxococcota bacterium]